MTIVMYKPQGGKRMKKLFSYYLFAFLCSYSSGGEDGYVRIHTFDPSYFDFKFDF